MVYTFVHLSDLHYRSGWEEENGLVCDHLLRDLKSECQDLANTHVAFTGDLVFSADDATGYSHFLNSFGPRLDAAGIGQSKRFTIPGNHDVSRQAIEKKLTLQNGAVAATDTERSFNDNLPELEAEYFAAKFSAYRSCEAKFAKYTCCANDLGGGGWTLPGGIGVYCLNTALASSAGLNDQNGNRIIDKTKLPIATRELHRWLLRDDSRFRILLAHHPLSWLTPWASDELQRTINSDFHLVLTGHLHSGDSFGITRSVRHTVYCAAPALFTRKNEELGYSIVSVDGDSGEIVVKYRQ